MSLFVDVIEILSNTIKASLLRFIESEKMDHERSVRKICDTCAKFLDYGELRYDKMEDGIRILVEKGDPGDSLNMALLGILNESLDEDTLAVKYFSDLAESSAAEPFREALQDFIIIGRCITLKEYDLLEQAGTIVIERYTDEQNVTDTLTNLYLKLDHEDFIPVFRNLLAKAKTYYPSGTALEGLNGYMSLRAKDYQKALESFLIIKDRIEKDTESRFYHFNLATTWDSIAVCYLRSGDAHRTLESCSIALEHDKQTEGDQRIDHALRHKQAEAYLLLDNKEEAIAILDRLLTENPEDQIALELKNRTNDG